MYRVFQCEPSGTICAGAGSVEPSSARSVTVLPIIQVVRTVKHKVLQVSNLSWVTTGRKQSLFCALVGTGDSFRDEQSLSG